MRIFDIDLAIKMLLERAKIQPVSEEFPKNSNDEKCVPISSIIAFLDLRPSILSGEERETKRRWECKKKDEPIYFGYYEIMENIGGMFYCKRKDEDE